jgi:hypothetical protein
MNNYQLKLLAALLMLIDHIGAVFFPDRYALRMIGRFSFPLFILLLIDGETYTRNIQRYGLRLFLLGFVTQPIYNRILNPGSINILFTLLLGLISLRLVRRLPNAAVLIWAVAAGLAEALKLEYGAYGIAAIALIQKFSNHPLWWIAWVGLHGILSAIAPEVGLFQIPALFAPLLLNLANHQPGAKARWLYLFYPLHILALWVIQTLRVANA